MASIGDHDLLASQMVIAFARNSRGFDQTFDGESSKYCESYARYGNEFLSSGWRSKNRLRLFTITAMFT